MAWPFSPSLLAALTSSHEMAVRIDVFDSQGLRRGNIPFQGGQINASLLAAVSRSGQFEVSKWLTRAGLLDPRRDRVQILTGVKGFPLVPIFTGRVTDVAPSDSGMVQVQVEDYGRDIVGATFEQPWQATPFATVADEMRRLIQDADGRFAVDTSRALYGQVPVITWEDDRARALDELATSINCLWQPDRTGGFTIFPNPYNLTSVPAWALDLSDGPGGTLTSCTENRTRDGVYNSITVLVELADNSVPIRVTVRDTKPTSPFFWGGEFGKVNRTVRLQAAGGPDAALVLANRLLNQSLALYRSWRLTTPHFPLLDPGDVISVTQDGETTLQVVESLSYPLEAIQATSIATRQLRQETEVNS